MRKQRWILSLIIIVLFSLNRPSLFPAAAFIYDDVSINGVGLIGKKGGNSGGGGDEETTVAPPTTKFPEPDESDGEEITTDATDFLEETSSSDTNSGLVPKTGDRSFVVIYLILATGCLGVLILLVKKKRDDEESN